MYLLMLKNYEWIGQLVTHVPLRLFPYSVFLPLSGTDHICLAPWLCDSAFFSLDPVTILILILPQESIHHSTKQSLSTFSIQWVQADSFPWHFLLKGCTHPKHCIMPSFGNKEEERKRKERNRYLKAEDRGQRSCANVTQWIAPGLFPQWRVDPCPCLDFIFLAVLMDTFGYKFLKSY